MNTLRRLILVALACIAVAAPASAQAPAPAPGPSTVRVTVHDVTDAVLVHAVVTLVDPTGAERVAEADARGVATFTGLQPGQYQLKAAAEGFREIVMPFTVRRGNNQTTLKLSVAMSEEIRVENLETRSPGDQGFTQTLTQEEIDALPDDPDEMAEELMRLAGPGAQIFVDGFRGGRLPPKDQIQQIRFHTNSYSAEYHQAGMVRVEVITTPGLGDWRGMGNVGFRDESLNARNAFAPDKGPEQMRRYMVSTSGPLVKGKTGLSISADGNNSYESRTIVAQAPDGPVNGLALVPADAVNFNVRLQHQMAPGNQIQAEYARRTNDRRNLGVGDFDLPERAFATESSTDMLRIRNTRLFGKKVFGELRVEFSDTALATVPGSTAPTLRVNDAFTAGGAGQSGERHAREIQLAQNVDFTIGRRHSLRAGVLLEAGWWDSTQRSNGNGTYVFTSLDAFNAGRPATYTIRAGDPLVAYSQVKAGWFLQDDFRLAKTLQVSLGLRQELQTQIDSRWNFAPRGALTWNATKRTTVRGGYGIFYDWYESNLYEQTLRVDGTHQVDVIVENPGFPVGEGGGTRLPPSVIRAASLDQPVIQQASLGLERSVTDWLGLRADYMWTRGSSTLRSINVNAPADGVRPDATVGNISEIQSTGRRASDRLTFAADLRYMPRRIVGHVMYQYQNARNHADGPTSLPADSRFPDADWGPSAEDVRHRVFFVVNTPVGWGTRASINVSGSSARPYTITTGRDDNGDTVFNDRPAGVGRNSARGAGQWNTNLRLSKSIGLGGPRGGPMGIPPLPGGTGGALNQQRAPGPPGGGDGPQIAIMEGAALAAKYRIDLYAQVSNLFNTVNDNTFVGNLLSPFFGQATSAGPARRVELGISLNF
jgi:hypothetical protein